MEFKIDAQPFSWTDKLAETAIEDFEAYQKDMSYGASTSIGLALAKLKMIEEGYLVELPCKPGDTVYVPHRGRIQEMTVTSARIDNFGFWFFEWKVKDDKGVYPWLVGFSCGQIGKYVFLTEHEAQKALEGMKK